jgi:Holliday junction resolvase
MGYPQMRRRFADEAIREAFRRNGDVRLTAIELGCSKPTVYAALKRLGISTPRRSKFSDTALAEAYARHGSVRLAARDLGCSHQVVARALKRLGVPLRPATRRGDEEIVAAVHRHHNIRLAAEELGVSATTVHRRLARLDVSVERRRRSRLTDDQILAAYKEHGCARLAAEALGTTRQTVHRRLQQLDIIEPKPRPRSRFSDEAILAAYRKHGKVSLAAAEVGASCSTIRRRLRRLGVFSGDPLKYQRRPPQPWTEEEVEMLRREYARFRDSGRLSDLASRLGRDKCAVITKARGLGLQRKSLWKHITNEEARAVFDAFKRSRLSVGNYCTREGYGPGFGQTMRRFFPEEYNDWVEAMWPKETWYVRGRQFELNVRKHLERNGYPHVVRSFRSRGIADLTAVGPAGTLLVQCKRGGYLRPVDHNELWELAHRCGATPLLAGLPDGRNKRFWVLTGPHTRRGHRPIREITFPYSAEAGDRLADAA